MIDPLTRRLVERAGLVSYREGRGPVLLMYHGTPAAKESPASPYWLRADQFAKQLDLLQELGWHTAKVSDLHMPERLPAKTVIMTFDDGFANNYEGAFIPLVERHMCATWYLVSDAIGKNAPWMKTRRAQTPLLALEQLREMLAQGMEIGSHTAHHLDLTRLGQPALKEEIHDSKKRLEDTLCVTVASFAYPFGRYNDAVQELVRQSGYAFACITRPGWFGSLNNPWALRRVTVFRHDSISVFARKLAFADNNVMWRRLTPYLFNRAISRIHQRQD